MQAIRYKALCIKKSPSYASDTHPIGNVEELSTKTQLNYFT